MEHYLATFYPAKEGGYTVMFGDFPEALTQGRDMREAMDSAREALALTIEEYIKEGRELPLPMEGHEKFKYSLAHKPAEPNSDGSFYVAIPAPVQEAPPVRVSVSFTRSALAKIDQKAEALGMTRSGYLATAGIGYNREPGKSVEEQLEEYGKAHGLARKPTEKWIDFLGRIFKAEKEKAHA